MKTGSKVTVTTSTASVPKGNGKSLGSGMNIAKRHGMTMQVPKVK